MIEVRGAGPRVAGVVPEPDRHRRHRLPDHELTQLADDFLAVIVEGSDVDPEAAPAISPAYTGRSGQPWTMPVHMSVPPAAVDEEDAWVDLLVDPREAVDRKR